MKLHEIHSESQFVDRAYTNGYQAFRDGEHLDDNPFPEKSPLHQAWKDGWTEAARERAIPSE